MLNPEYEGTAILQNVGKLLSSSENLILDSTGEEARWSGEKHCACSSNHFLSSSKILL
jgi:hypothetical protein